MLRPLNRIEEAFTLSNETYPMCVCITLKLRNGPSTRQLRLAADGLQARHLLLRSRIVSRHGRFVFDRMEQTVPIPLTHVERDGDADWERAVERELNTYFDPAGPLLRLVHVSGPGEDSEVILVLHHAIMDGVSARLLLHELLHLSTELPLPAPLSESDQLARHAFPPGFRGLPLALKLPPFMIRQLWKDAEFARRGINAPAAARGYNRVRHLALPADVSRRINYHVGRAGLTLNSVLGAALLLAVRRVLHAGDPRSMMRAIAFADLRPLLRPPPSEAVLGCMISMLRFSLQVREDADLREVAAELMRAMYRGGKRGTPFLFASLSKLVTRMMLLQRRSRMASSALSFLGKLELEPNYASTELRDVHAFITNNLVGPEFSGFGKVLFGRIELDLTYLESEISDATANELISVTEVSLNNLANGQ